MSGAEFRGPKGGTGPVQRPPSEWQKGRLEIGKEPDQGAAKTSRPTSRSLNPGNLGPGANFTTDTLAGRPGVAARRALAPIPTEVSDVWADAPGGFVAQQLAGVGSPNGASPEPGDDGNVSQGIDGMGGVKFAKGSASKVTGGTVKGSTGMKGMI